MGEIKKLGGAFAIEDEALRYDMAQANAGGKPCRELGDLISESMTGTMMMLNSLEFNETPGDTSRYISCFASAGYDHDLTNEMGCASPMDAAQAHVDLVLEGYSVYVWDRVTNLVHVSEANEHLYASVEKLRTPKPLAERIERLDENALRKLRTLIDARLSKNTAQS